MKNLFGRFAMWTASVIGTPTAFAVVMVVYVLWALSGPFLHFSDTWQLVINTATTLWTGALIVLLQYTQNRDTAEIKQDIKDSKTMILDLVKSVPEADTSLAEEIEQKPCQTA